MLFNATKKVVYMFDGFGFYVFEALPIWKWLPLYIRQCSKKSGSPAQLHELMNQRRSINEDVIQNA